MTLSKLRRKIHWIAVKETQHNFIWFDSLAILLIQEAISQFITSVINPLTLQFPTMPDA